jgi:hypothetical protein
MDPVDIVTVNQVRNLAKQLPILEQLLTKDWELKHNLSAETLVGDAPVWLEDAYLSPRYSYTVLILLY